MIRHRIAAWTLACAAVIVVTACSGTAGPTASTAGQNASLAASTDAASVAPSVAVASETPLAIPSGLVIPSFELPSSDKELEALLPQTLCGVDVLKFSMKGETFIASADPQLVSLLGWLDKTPADVRLAVAGSVTGGCTAGIFRINGADTASFKQAFIDRSVAEGTVYQQATIGGKDVLVGPDASEFQYAYFKGDALFFVTGGTDAQAAETLDALP